VKIPSTIISGDSVSWLDASGVDSLGNTVTSTDWTLTWYFSGPTILSVVSTANNDGWKTSLTSAQTAAMTAVANPSDAANYFWQATASKLTEKVTLGTGTLSITQNLANAVAGYSGKTQAEQDLLNIQSAIRARISGGVIHEYHIGTRRLRNEPVAELLKLESRFKLIVSKERQAQSIANGLGDPRNTFVRFS